MKHVKVFEAFHNNDGSEDAVYQAFLGDLDSTAELLDAYSQGISVKARKTDQTWDDGVPVLKYISRASKKSVKIPKGEFKVIHDPKFGWWYFKMNNFWYGMDTKDYDNYPPFEY